MNSRKLRNITLEELVALNDEIIALVRAGVPLEMGLQELSEDRAGILGRLGSRLAGRLSQGESLPEAMDREDINLPRSYRVIVEAGLRSGRLTAALEGVSEMASKMADLRRRIGLAFVYPLIVLMLAYGLFLLFATQLFPRVKWAFHGLGFQTENYDWVITIGREAHWWGWILPAAVVAMILWWRRSGMGGFLSDDGQPIGIARWCPGVRRTMKYYRYAQFADLMALLIEQDVPLQEAIVLAAESTNDLPMIYEARSIADVTSRGLNISLKLPGNGFPPFLEWLITRREEQDGMVSALRAAAEMYRRKAELITEWIKIMFPVAAVVIIGGGATWFYVRTIFFPLIELLKNLANPVT